MPLLAISQNVYPTKSIIGADTVVIFNLRQSWAIDSMLINLDGCNEFSDTMRSVVKRKNFAISAQQNLINNYEGQLQIGKDIIKNQDILLGGYRKLDRQSQVKLKWLRLQRNALVGVVAVLAVKILLFK